VLRKEITSILQTDSILFYHKQNPEACFGIFYFKELYFYKIWMDNFIKFTFIKQSLSIGFGLNRNDKDFSKKSIQ